LRQPLAFARSGKQRIGITPLQLLGLRAAADQNLAVRSQPRAEATPEATAVDLRPTLSGASLDGRRELLAAFLVEQVSRVLALGEPRTVPLDRSLMDMGMDSLMAMELRNRIDNAAGVKVQVADLLQGPTITELADSVARAVVAVEPEREEMEL
jgi:aryl carrier-like protein